MAWYIKNDNIQKVCNKISFISLLEKENNIPIIGIIAYIIDNKQAMMTQQ